MSRYFVLNRYRGITCMVDAHPIPAGQMMRVVTHEGGRASEYLCAPHVQDPNWVPRGTHTFTYAELGPFGELAQTYQARCSCGWTQELPDGHGTSLHVARNAAAVHLMQATSPLEARKECARGN